MTQYKVAFFDSEKPSPKDFPSQTVLVKAETVGLAVLGAIGNGPRPKSVKTWALTRHKGKDLWVECHVSPSFLEAMIHLG